MDKSVSKKLSYIYLLMTVMIIAVHSVSAESMGFTGLALTVNEYLRLFWGGATGAFFFFSALLMFRKEHGYKELLLKKIKSLLVPYICFNTIALLFSIFKDLLLKRTFPDITFLDVLKSIFLAQSNAPLWFMRVLMEFVILYPVINWLAKKAYLGFGVAIISVAVNYIIGIDNGYSTILYWLPIYMCGAVIARNYENIFFNGKLVKNKWAQLVSLVLLIAAVYISSLNDNIYYLYRIIFPVLIWIVLDCFSLLPNPKWWVKCTIFYYGMHVMLVSFVGKIYHGILGGNLVIQLMSNILVPLGCLIIMIIMAAIIKKLMPPVWNILTGSRK